MKTISALSRRLASLEVVQEQHKQVVIIIDDIGRDGNIIPYTEADIERLQAEAIAANPGQIAYIIDLNRRET